MSSSSDVRHVLVLGHPAVGSFNHAVADRYVEIARANYQEVEVRDLYRLGFDPLLKDDERQDHPSGVPGKDAKAELDAILSADVVTLVYPLWFGLPPAVIKGYLDRVFGAAFAPARLGADPGSGPFAGKRLALFTSSASSSSFLDEHGMMVSLRQTQGEYFRHVFGFDEADYFHADRVTQRLDSAASESLLYAAGEKVRSICAAAQGARRHA